MFVSIGKDKERLDVDEWRKPCFRLAFNEEEKSSLDEELLENFGFAEYDGRPRRSNALVDEILFEDECLEW